MKISDQFPQSVKDFVSQYRDYVYTNGEENKHPWLKLLIDAPFKEMLAEAKAMNEHFVNHMENSNDPWYDDGQHQGWFSINLHNMTDSKVYYNSNLAPSASAVSSIVQNNANKYAESSEMNKYGARFKYSKFLKIVDDSHEAVTSNITTVKMRRDLRVVTNSFAEYSIGFGNEFYIKSMDGYNIKSTGFTVAGINDVVYLGDVPDTNRVTGTIFLFTVPNVGSQSPTIIRRNAGTINYVSGIVTLNPINVLTAKDKDGIPIIEIEASPLSNDVVGLQDLYLQLDIGGSNFEMVIDEISSGLDPSASNYIVSSSYANGNLVRAGGSTTTISGAQGTTGTTGGTSVTTTTGVSGGTSYSTPTTTTSTSGSSGSSSSY